MRKRTIVRIIAFLSAGLVVAGTLAVTGLRRARALELCPDGADGALDPTAPVPRHAVATILARWHRLGV